jgi:exonuclease III
MNGAHDRFGVRARTRRRRQHAGRREAALALRPSMAPTGPAPDRLRVATWNLNSLRARLGAVERLLDRTRPEILCLQETKAASLSEAAATAFADLGYEVTHVGAGSYNGGAILARHSLEDVRGSGGFDDEHLDREPRVVSCVVQVPEPLRVVSVYVPMAGPSTTGTTSTSSRSSSR